MKKKLNPEVNDEMCFLTNLVPNLDEIGMHNEIIDRVENFNNRYNTNLGVTKKLRWKPGIYTEIQKGAVDCAFWKFKSKPANGYKWTEFNQYAVKDYRRDLRIIEERLFLARQRGETLTVDRAIAKERFDKFLDTLFDSEKGKKYFEHSVVGHDLPGILHRQGARFGRRSHLIRTRDFSNPLVKEGIATFYDAKPRIAFKVDVDNIDMDFYARQSRSSEDRSERIHFARVPYGNLSIVFEIDLYWWANNYPSNPRNIDASITRYSDGGHRDTPGLAHPYIKLGGGTYQNGNICFGDLTTQILEATFHMRWNVLDDLLRHWASNYIFGISSPLNTYDKCMIGLKEEYAFNHLDKHDMIPEDYEGALIINREIMVDRLAPDSKTCENILSTRNDEDEMCTPVEWFESEHCNNCMIQSNCETYSSVISGEGQEMFDNLLTALRDAGVDSPTRTRRRTASSRTLDVFIFDMNISELARQYSASLKQLTIDEQNNSEELPFTLRHHELSEGFARNVERLTVLEKLYNLKDGRLSRYDNGESRLSRYEFGHYQNHISISALQETEAVLTLQALAAHEHADERRREYEGL